MMNVMKTPYNMSSNYYFKTIATTINNKYLQDFIASMGRETLDLRFYFTDFTP